MTLWPWNEVGKEASPFVQIFTNAGFTATANILNFVVLTAAVSVYNSALYSNSRMLYGLAKSGNAPRIFERLSKRGVPVNGILISSGITLLAAVLNYFLPDQVFMYMMAVVTGAVVISWAMIIMTHLKFRKHCAAVGIVPKFKALFYPVADYLCLAFLAMILVIMALMDDMRPAVIVMPIWIAAIWTFYRSKR